MAWADFLLHFQAVDVCKARVAGVRVGVGVVPSILVFSIPRGRTYPNQSLRKGFAIGSPKSPPRKVASLFGVRIPHHVPLLNAQPRLCSPPLPGESHLLYHDFYVVLIHYCYTLQFTVSMSVPIPRPCPAPTVRELDSPQFPVTLAKDYSRGRGVRIGPQMIARDFDKSIRRGKQESRGPTALSLLVPQEQVSWYSVSLSSKIPAHGGPTGSGSKGGPKPRFEESWGEPRTGRCRRLI